ncbi:unnamed protein product [Miscanthus lutarioriparius]|uniref:chitinase n=1 Tax=Miscanthus lutarioriparius TaxID=422564 RepID=A0A811P2V9_9POAL|nr:unnamed protein product [Miscanthus lutarioriparius]
MASVVTESFNGIKSHGGSWCEGIGFYTRSAFLKAVAAYPGFAHGGSEVERKREIAAFFAHVTHETGHLCYINEIDVAKYCDWKSEKQWPCYPAQGYYGRGPLQLSWNYNYGPAGRSLGFDGLRDPDRVAQDPVLSFKSALWYWMENMHQRTGCPRVWRSSRPSLGRAIMPQGFDGPSPRRKGHSRNERPRAILHRVLPPFRH